MSPRRELREAKEAAVLAAMKELEEVAAKEAEELAAKQRATQEEEAATGSYISIASECPHHVHLHITLCNSAAGSCTPQGCGDRAEDRYRGSNR